MTLWAEEFKKLYDQTSPTDLHARHAEVLRAEAEQLRARKDEHFPAEPTRDVMLFLLEHAPLKPWQLDVLSIIRDEAYYFAPQGQTKIMNEGWASYWHSTIMTRQGLTSAEVINYADHHSGTMASSPMQLNPYKLGIELLRDIEELDTAATARLLDVSEAVVKTRLHRARQALRTLLDPLLAAGDE